MGPQPPFAQEGGKFIDGKRCAFNLHIIGLERWEWMKKIRFPLYRSIVEDEVEIEFASK